MKMISNYLSKLKKMVKKKGLEFVLNYKIQNLRIYKKVDALLSMTSVTMYIQRKILLQQLFHQGVDAQLVVWKSQKTDN